MQSHRQRSRLLPQLRPRSQQPRLPRSQRLPPPSRPRRYTRRCLCYRSSTNMNQAATKTAAPKKAATKKAPATKAAAPKKAAGRPKANSSKTRKTPVAVSSCVYQLHRFPLTVSRPLPFQMRSQLSSARPSQDVSPRPLLLSQQRNPPPRSHQPRRRLQLRRNPQLQRRRRHEWHVLFKLGTSAWNDECQYAAESWCLRRL